MRGMEEYRSQGDRMYHCVDFPTNGGRGEGTGGLRPTCHCPGSLARQGAINVTEAKYVR
jgi:hypothetical protein